MFKNMIPSPSIEGIFSLTDFSQSSKNEFILLFEILNRNLVKVSTNH